jgi:hypothetical protein
VAGDVDVDGDHVDDHVDDLHRAARERRSVLSRPGRLLVC